MFDLGAFTIDEKSRILVSELVHGSGQFQEVLLRHHGRPIASPSRSEYSPHAEFLAWHYREVFRGRPRSL
jgi:putative restriction endonuclease